MVKREEYKVNGITFEIFYTEGNAVFMATMENTIYYINKSWVPKDKFFQEREQSFKQKLLKEIQ